MRTRLVPFAVSILLANPWIASAAPHPVRWNNHSLIEAHTLKALPEDLRAKIAAESPIADRGWRFNYTDVVDEKLPMRRFVLAGTDDSLALVAIEHGGRGYYVEALEFENSSGKWTQSRRFNLSRKPVELQDLVNLLTEPKKEAKAPEIPAERKPEIYFSEAPWDGAAYEIQIPQEKSKDAPDPVIRVNIWGNPKFTAPETIAFTGKEDSGGGPGKGNGTASYQTRFNSSLPQRLAGTITFQSIQPNTPVSAAYDLTSQKGDRFKGTFVAPWGNQSLLGPIR